MKDTTTVTVTDSPGLMALAAHAHGRNRSVHEDMLARDIDMDGYHMLIYVLLHNDCEWRTRWLVKIKGQEEPIDIWLDLPLDALDRHTTTMILDGEEWIERR